MFFVKVFEKRVRIYSRLGPGRFSFAVWNFEILFLGSFVGFTDSLPGSRQS